MTILRRTVRHIPAVLALAFACGAAADDLANGLEAIRRKDYFAAIRLLLPLAQSGNAQAQMKVGELYFHGHGVKESDADALQWFERSATQGVADAQYQLGNMYAYGLGVPRDDLDADRKAAQAYFAAARQGHRDAQYALGILFLAGKGVQRSEQEALNWMQRAADQGHADAKNYVSGYSR